MYHSLAYLDSKAQLQCNISYRNLLLSDNNCSNINNCMLFSGLVTTISKLTKLCVLRLSKESFYFIALDESSLPLRTSVWCEMQQSHFFNEYKLVGAPEDDNEIYLELSPGII